MLVSRETSPVSSGIRITELLRRPEISYPLLAGVIGWGEQITPMLAERLRDESFHMTLHGLEDGVPGTPGLAERMSAAAALARPILARHRQGPALRMRATRLFNMLHTSVVLGLAPADGDSYARLDAMYLELEEVKRLGYALTPHITMAYYRPGRYSAAQAARLASALRPVELELSLAMEDLVLQDFTDMNRYTTVF